MKPRIVLLAGWAYPAGSLQLLADRLRERADVALCDAEADLAVDAPTSWLAGWSLGGIRCLLHAAAHPGACAGLILLSSTARFCATDGYEAGVKPALVRGMLRGLRRDPGPVAADFHVLCAAPAPLPPEDRDARTRASLAIGASRLSAGLGFLLEADARDAAASLRVPALVVHGRGDRVVPPSAADWLCGHIPQAAAVRVDDAGHDLPLRSPARIADAMLRFVQGCA